MEGGGYCATGTFPILRPLITTVVNWFVVRTLTCKGKTLLTTDVKRGGTSDTDAPDMFTVNTAMRTYAAEDML